MREFFEQAAADGKSIVGAGAPAKGNTLLNTAGITSAKDKAGQAFTSAFTAPGTATQMLGNNFGTKSLSDVINDFESQELTGGAGSDIGQGDDVRAFAKNYLETVLYPARDKLMSQYNYNNTLGQGIPNSSGPNYKVMRDA